MHFIEPHYLLALAFVILGKAGITGGELSAFHSRLQKAMKEKHIRALFYSAAKISKRQCSSTRTASGN